MNTKTEDLYADYSDEDLMIGGATIKLRPISQNRNVSYIYTSSKIPWLKFKLNICSIFNINKKIFSLE